jgi:hypothetical protein
VGFFAARRRTLTDGRVPDLGVVNFGALVNGLRAAPGVDARVVAPAWVDTRGAPIAPAEAVARRTSAMISEALARSVE